jgi:hypothetical protein
VARHILSRITPLIATVLITHAALAAPSAADKATAQTLYDDGMKLIAKKEYDSACKKLEESDRLDPGMGTKYRLAECYEHLGRTASAWVLFREVADEAKASAQNDREKRARDRANKLESKLSRLTINVTAAPKGLEVKRDGSVIGEGQFGAAVAIDPGSHVIEATAPGKRPFSTTIDVTPPGSTVTIPALEDVPVFIEQPKKAEPPPSASWQKPTALVVGGVGIVALGVSTVVILSARSAMKDSEPHCVSNACDPEGAELRDRAVSRGNISTAFFVVGVVAVAGASVLYLTAPSDNTPRVGIRPGFISVEGRF